MKLVLYQRASKAGTATPRPGILADQGVVDISSAVAGFGQLAPHEVMPRIIDRFDDLRSELDGLVGRVMREPLSTVRLRAPIPRPGKILCCIGNHWEHAQGDPR